MEDIGRMTLRQSRELVDKLIELLPSDMGPDDEIQYDKRPDLTDMEEMPWKSIVRDILLSPSAYATPSITLEVYRKLWDLWGPSAYRNCPTRWKPQPTSPIRFMMWINPLIACRTGMLSCSAADIPFPYTAVYVDLQRSATGYVECMLDGQVTSQRMYHVSLGVRISDLLICCQAMRTKEVDERDKVEDVLHKLFTSARIKQWQPHDLVSTLVRWADEEGDYAASSSKPYGSVEAQPPNYMKAKLRTIAHTLPTLINAITHGDTGEFIRR